MSLVVPLKEIFQKETGLLSKHHSWERVELGRVCEVLNGYAFKSSLFNKSNGFPLIRIRDLARNATQTFFDGEYPSNYVVRNGDLLVGMDGNFGCYEWSGDDALLNQRVCKLTADGSFLLPKFLLFSLNGYLKAIQDATSSVTVGHLSSRDLLNIPIPFPPLNEQKRIVEKLEKLLGKGEAAEERLDKIPAILKRFRQSVLAAACSGKLTADWRENKEIDLETELPTGWIVESVGNVIEDLKYGTSQKCGLEEKGVPVLRIPNIGEWFVDKTNLKYAVLPSKEFNPLKLAVGDILLIRSNGSVSLVGKTAIVRNSEKDFAYAGYLIRLRPDTAIIYPEFFNYVLGSYDVRVQIEIPARSTSGVNNINSTEVKALQIPVPSLEEQKEIVRRVEDLFKLADQIEERYEKARSYTDKLTQSILAKAFRGELVPQDPTDEPASALLERLKNDLETKKG